MSIVRQIKILAALDILLVIFSAWTAAANLLFKNPADYRLFLLSLASMLLMQYIHNKINNKYMTLIVPIIVSVPFMWILFHGTAIFFNVILVEISIYIILSMEELPVDYEDYKSKAKQGAIIFIIIALVCLGLEKAAADLLYRFFINYIIVTVILLRESRAYSYKVRKENKKAGTLTNIIFNYIAAAASTITFSTDWILNESMSLISIINNAMDTLIINVLELFSKILGPVLEIIISNFRKLLNNIDLSEGYEEVAKRLSNVVKNIDFTQNGSNGFNEIFVYTSIKIVLLIIAVLFIVDVVKKMSFTKYKNEEYIEEKEKIYKDRKKDYEQENGIASMLKKVFKINKTIRDKILRVYRDFEILADKEKLYKPYMTAAQLKNAAKVIIKNDSYLEEMTHIYNEAKFSKNEPKEKQLEAIRKALNSIKKHKII